MESFTSNMSEKLADIRDKIIENQRIIIGVICAIVIIYIIYNYGGSRFTAKGSEKLGTLSDIETELKSLIEKINKRQEENLKK